jgi:hypothetical protein
LSEHLGGFSLFEQDCGARIRDRFQFSVFLRVERIDLFGGAIVERGEEAAQLEICTRVVLKITSSWCS